MSADNWTECPRCEKRRESRLARQKEDLDNAYGSVSLEDFDAMRADYNAALSKPIQQTLREDYEIGLWDHEFHVIYSGGCRDCGFGFKYEHTEQVGDDS